jgi:hypothetical protein
MGSPSSGICGGISVPSGWQALRFAEGHFGFECGFLAGLELGMLGSIFGEKFSWKRDQKRFLLFQ